MNFVKRNRKNEGIYVQLTLKKDQEYRVFISDRITDDQEFMYPVYRRGLDALRFIVRQTTKFNVKQNGIGLYGYCHNIIVFSGSRGQGKTSVMLSFSHAMKNFDHEPALEKNDLLRQCRFAVLPPIDPTVLEKDQSILAVILSRMYRMAEETWSKPCSSMDFSNNFNWDEAKRNELLQLFQQCLSGINSIKFREGKEIRGLIEMHEISDSAVLKDNIYKLTNELLRFHNDSKDERLPFLVVQLDDTDFQTRKCYEIMEDIRKYLTIPNIVILMATDLDMLHTALTQQYIHDFQDGIKGKIIHADKLRKVESKYLDKLIPPNHAVYLPHLDEIIREQNALLNICYLDEDALGREIDLLRPPTGAALNFSFQESIFRLVYQKTRIAFVPKEGCVHNLMPTTLRGFAQFFVMISSMQDVLEVTELGDINKMINQVSSQLDVLDKNLPLFEDYFLNSWVHAKLKPKHADVIESLTAMEPASWPQYVVKQLLAIYDDNYKPSESFEEDFEKFKNDCHRQENLTIYLQRWGNLRLPPDDTYFIFALRMVFDLHFHKMVAARKRQAIRDYQKNKRMLLFDFSLLGGTQLFNEPPLVYSEAFVKTIRMDQYDRIVTGIKGGEKYASLLLHRTDKGDYSFDPLNFIAFFLVLGSPEYKEMMSGETAQSPLYLVQTTCATIAINSDIQIAVRKALEEWEMWGESESPYLDRLQTLFGKITTTIQLINTDKEGKAPPMILSWMKDIIPLMDEADNRSVFRSLLVRLKDELTQDSLRLLCDIYNCAEKLSKALSTSPVDPQEAQKLWKLFVDASIPYSTSSMIDGIDLHALEPICQFMSSGEDIMDTESSIGNPFWEMFKKDFGTLCQKLNYQERTIIAQIQNERKH